jgi:hypothetical protein
MLGSLLLLALQLFGAQWLQSNYGVNLAAVPDARLLMYALVFLGLSAALALLPALGAYRASLQGRLAGSE